MRTRGRLLLPLPFTLHQARLRQVEFSQTSPVVVSTVCASARAVMAFVGL